MCLRIKLEEIVVTSAPKRTVLNNADPFMPCYASKGVITTTQDFNRHTYFTVLHCVTI